MTKCCTWIVSVLMLFSSLPGLLFQPELDQADLYDSALIHVRERKLEEARAQFQQLGPFIDSAQWVKYCDGLLLIQKANQLESQGYILQANDEIRNAQALFSELKKDKNGFSDFFRGSGEQQLYESPEDLCRYCDARQAEYSSINNGETYSQTALDLYHELIGIEDSEERYERIRNRIPIPTQVPVPVPLPPIPAHAEESISVYLGPSLRYKILDGGILQVNEKTELYICGTEGNYYLLEARTDKGLIRCWASKSSVRNDQPGSSPQKVGQARYKHNYVLLRASQAYYGPGDAYLKTDLIIDKGTKVTGYETEGEYTMIEYSIPSAYEDVRVWVKTEDLILQ